LIGLTNLKQEINSKVQEKDNMENYIIELQNNIKETKKNSLQIQNDNAYLHKEHRRFTKENTVKNI
jgi:hypothetical protein